MGTVQVVQSAKVVSPFRARATVLGRRFREVGLQVLHNYTAMTGLCLLAFFFFLGTQISLIVGIFSAIVASVIGTVVGLVSGFVGGWVDEVIMRVNDVVLSIPWLVLMIVVAARVSYLDIWGIVFVIGFTGWSVTARVIRSQVLSLKERMFVERGRMIGSSNAHILIRHIFPNAFPLIFANTILTVAISILSESVLAFLGLSVKNNVSWGRIIAEAYENDALTIGMPGWMVVPGLCIVFLVFGFYLFGYALDEILNPRLRRR